MATIVKFTDQITREMIESAEMIKPPMQFYTEIMNSHYDFLEECLLAVMAAGIPASCIAVTHPRMIENIEWKSLEMHCGFEFIDRIN